VIVAAWLAACAPGSEPRGTIDVAANVDRAADDFGQVTIRGLSPKQLQRAVAGDGPLAVFTGLGADSVAADSPPLSGRWRKVRNAAVFTPRFPPAPGVAIWVRYTSRDSLRWWRFELTGVGADTVSPRLVAIHPSLDTLPENLLRWYLEFSRPMRPGQALDHVRLVDSRGKVDHTAFLATSEELWNPDGTRLTLLFDPGRVKRGVRTNVVQGRPLVAGQRYHLRVEAGWQDLSGRPLDTAFDKTFVVFPADNEGADPQRWSLKLPAPGSNDPLIVSFAEPLDHALASRLIGVHDERSERLEGTTMLRQNDREWLFTPADPWRAARYQLLVSPELEDVAGNRPGKPFDHQAAEQVGGGAPSAPLIRWFEPKSR
jgi:hypothetical protein